MKKIKFQEKGQALIIIALAVVVLFGFAALAIDGSRVFSDKRNAQNAADTAALAAALARVRGQDYVAAAQVRATSNSYTTGVNDSVVEVNLCSDTGITCEGLAGAPSEYVKVRITSIVPMTFARIIGKTQITNVSEAIARANVNPPPPDWRKAGMVAVKGDSSDKCFLANGNANLTIHGSGIFVNCTGSQALFLNGTADIGMDANAQVAGCTNDLNFDVSPGKIACGATQQTIDASTFASYPTTLQPPSCGGPGGQSGSNMSPGNFNSQVTISTPTTLAPGTYCLNAGMKFTGGGSISGAPGTVQLVFASGQGVTLKSDGNAFDGLEIYMNNADFTVFGTLTANMLRFFGTGTSGFGVQGGTLSSGNAYIYSEGGLIDIQAQAAVTLAAPTSGTFAGLLIHTPWSNTNPYSLAGGTDDHLTGTILVPHSDVTFNGGEGFKLYGQIIGYTFKVNGGGHSDIYFDPGTIEAVDPTIEFIK